MVEALLDTGFVPTHYVTAISRKNDCLGYSFLNLKILSSEQSSPLLGQNTQYPQDKGGKIYFNSYFVEISVPSRLAPRRSRTAEHQIRGETIHEMVDRKTASGSSMTSIFPLYSIQAAGYGIPQSW